MIWPAADLRFALRTLRRNPAFLIAALLTLALGIGVNTTMFTVIRAVLLKPLEYREPERVVRIIGGATPSRYELLRTQSRSYAAVGAYSGGLENVGLSGAGGPEALKAARVSANFLEILGVRPLFGRSFQADEDTPSAPLVAMISSELWRRRFDSDPSIAGRTATLGGMPFTIIGVLPPGLQFPAPGVDVWVTRLDEWSLISPTSWRLSPVLSLFGRLRPRVDLARVDPMTALRL